MSTHPYRSLWRLLLVQVVIMLGVFALGRYFGQRLATAGGVPDQKTAPARKIPDKSVSLPLPGGEAAVREALARLFTPGKGKVDRNRIYAIIQSLDAKGIKALLDDPEAKAFVDRPGFYIRENLLRFWAKLDPAAALGWATGHVFPQREYAIVALYGIWASSDPDAALAALDQVKGTVRTSAFAAVIANYCKKDPVAALALLQSLPPLQTHDLYPRLFKGWAAKDPAAAAAAALNLPLGPTRNETLKSTAAGWMTNDPAATLAWVNTWTAGALKDGVVAQVLTTMSDKDAPGVAALLADYKIPPGDTRNNLLRTLAAKFAEQDPAGALAWADKNLVGQDFVSATANILQQISTTDPAAAVAYLGNITDPGVLKSALPAISKNWGAADPEAAIAWAQGLPADNAALRKEAMTGVFSPWVDSDPVAAGKYIAQNLVGDPSFSSLIGQVATNWAQADPQGAFTWAVSLPGGGDGYRSNAINTSLKSLTDLDPQAAMQAALTLPGQTQRTASPRSFPPGPTRIRSKPPPLCKICRQAQT